MRVSFCVSLLIFTSSVQHFIRTRNILRRTSVQFYNTENIWGPAIHKIYLHQIVQLPNSRILWCTHYNKRYNL